MGKKKVCLGRPPRSAAVSLTTPEGTTYASVMAKAKASIRLADLVITETLRFKRAITEAYLLEVPGQESAPKADHLKEELEKIFQDTGVRVARPA